jgi:hypothetical protein
MMWLRADEGDYEEAFRGLSAEDSRETGRFRVISLGLKVMIFALR